MKEKEAFVLHHQQMLSVLLLDNCPLISYSFLAVCLGREREGMIFKTFVLCNVCIVSAMGFVGLNGSGCCNLSSHWLAIFLHRCEEKFFWNHN